MIDTGHFFSSLGPAAYLLVLSSIAIVALSIERLVTLYTLPKIPLKQLKALTKLITDGDLKGASTDIAKLPNVFQEWIKILLNYPPKIAEDELSLIILDKRITLQRPLDWLNLFAITSPMLGLLGTIWSMSHSFGMIGRSLGNDGIQKIMLYLSEAMYATAFGIILAVISMLFLYLLRQKSEKYLSLCELTLNRINLALAHNTLKVGAEND